MTISTAASPLSYAGDDATVAFAITWAYKAKSHVVATLRDSAGAETVQTLTTHYTLTAPGATGTLTMVTAPATNETLVITSEPPNTQETDIPLGGSFPAASVEDALDLASQVDAKIQALFNRALRVPKTDTRSGSQLEIPNETDRASKFLTFDASGDPTVSVGSADTVTVSPFMATVNDDTTQEAAKTTLGLGTGDSPTLTGLTLSGNLTSVTNITTTGNIELGHASDTTLTRVSAGVVDVEGLELCNLEKTGTFTIGHDITPVADGTKTTGTFTPEPSTGYIQTVINGGAHTLAPPTETGVFILVYTNNASAGAITTSGFTLEKGDSFATTDTYKYECLISNDGTTSTLQITAQQ